VTGRPDFFQIAGQTDKQRESPQRRSAAGDERPRTGSFHLYQFKVVCLDRNTGKTLGKRRSKKLCRMKAITATTGLRRIHR
jgi:hypothetical protein